jgi:Tfp pilus assembly protein PilF
MKISARTGGVVEVQMRKRHWAPLRLMVSVWVIVCVFLVSLASAQNSATRREDEQRLQSAESLFEHGQHKEAQSSLEQILKRYPDSFGANELMGLVLSAQDHHEDAYRFLSKAVQVQPQSAEAHVNLATNLSHLNKPQLAEQEFKRAVLLKPRDYDMNHNLGEFYLHSGKIAEGIPYLQRAQEVNPGSYENGYDLALAEIQTSKLSEAESLINSLMRTRDIADLHALLAEVKEARHHFVAAGQEYQRAAQMDPSESNIFNWGAELLRHRTLDPAVPVLSQGVERYPNSARLRIGLGIAYYMGAFYDQAVDAFCRAADLDPRDTRPYYFLARIYDVSPSKAAEVTARLERLVQIQPDNAQARYAYAMSLWKSSRTENGPAESSKVEALLKSAVSLDPKFAEAHLQLGILYSQRGSDSEALAEYETAAKLDPSLADAHYRLGLALVRRGDKPRGERELKISSQLHTQQMTEGEEKNSQILRFVYTETMKSNP